jgi:hypothetical protein
MTTASGTSSIGATTSKNFTTMASTTVAVNNTRCVVQEFNAAKIRTQNGQCVSRDRIPRQRCSGYCQGDSDEECKCCGVGLSVAQPVIFDCIVNGKENVKEERMIEIRRIQSCRCNSCHNGNNTGAKGYTLS